MGITKTTILVCAIQLYLNGQSVYSQASWHCLDVEDKKYCLSGRQDVQLWQAKEVCELICGGGLARFDTKRHLVEFTSRLDGNLHRNGGSLQDSSYQITHTPTRCVEAPAGGAPVCDYDSLGGDPDINECINLDMDYNLQRVTEDHCLVLDTSQPGLLLEPRTCNTVNKLICQVQQDSGNCQDKFVFIPDYGFYLFSKQQKTWDDSRDTCQALDGDLVAIETENELDAILKYMIDHDMDRQPGQRLSVGWHWTSGNDRAVEGQYRWGSEPVRGNSPPRFRPYKPLGPKDCIYVCPTYKGLYVANCDSRRKAICELNTELMDAEFSPVIFPDI